MLNLYEFVKHESDCKKIVCEDLVFVEFKCEVELVKHGVWSQANFVAYVTSGRKIWITPKARLLTNEGEAVFLKKGGHLVENFLEEDFCALFFFISDDFIREVMQEYQASLRHLTDDASMQDPILTVDVNVRLKAFFDSVGSFFMENTSFPRELIRLKFKELLLHLLANLNNRHLLSFFKSLGNEGRVNLMQTMENNFLYHLSLEDFAKLCHHSLSTFKREFHQAFGMSPGKWITEQRLKHAKMRLLYSDDTINEVAFASGFENTPHFIRCFKHAYGLPPNKFRQRQLQLTE